MLITNPEAEVFGFFTSAGGRGTRAKVLLWIDEGKHNPEPPQSDSDAGKFVRMSSAAVRKIRQNYSEGGIVAALEPGNVRRAGLGFRKRHIFLTLDERRRLEEVLNLSDVDEAAPGKFDKRKQFAKALLEIDESKHGPDRTRTLTEVQESAEITSYMFRELMLLYDERGVNAVFDLRSRSNEKRIDTQRRSQS